MLTEAQKKARQRKIGGSDVAAIMGLSEFCDNTPYAIWCEKILGKPRVFDPEGWGHKLEPIILDTYTQKTGIQLKRPKEPYYHDKYEFMVANPDGVGIDNNIIIDAKTAHNYRKFGSRSDLTLPSDYLLQLAHYCIVLDADYAECAILFGGNDFQILRYDRNEELEKLIISKEKEFYDNYIITETPPPAKSKADLLHKYQKLSDGEVKKADSKIYEKVCELKSLSATIKEMEREKNDLITEIGCYMKDSPVLLDMQGKKLATWKLQKRESIDREKLKTEHPEVYKTVAKETQIRVFRSK